MATQAGDPELTSFDIFVLALSVLSIINMALAIAPLSAAVHNVVLIVDGVLCLIFLTDFFGAPTRAPHKRTYLLHEGAGLTSSAVCPSLDCGSLACSGWPASPGSSTSTGRAASGR